MRDINLFEGIKKIAPAKSGGKSAIAGLLLIIFCAAAVGGIYYWLNNQKNAIESEIEAANQQISAAAQTTGGTDMTVKQSQLTAIRTYNAMLTALEENITAYPELNAALLSDIEKRMPSGVSVRTLGYQNGILTLECAAGDADAPANFADALVKSDNIDSVMLTLNQLDVETELTTGVVSYNFAIDCYLKGGAGE